MRECRVNIWPPTDRRYKQQDEAARAQIQNRPASFPSLRRLAWQSSGTMLYRIKSETPEQLAHESELKLVLLRARKTSD
jgi:hypothetical protein